MPARDFLGTLAASPSPIIGEVKRTDADGRDLLGGADVGDVVDRYHMLGLPCLSVVTGRWFGGDLGLLSFVRARSSLPILRKDFITRSRDLRRSAELGADAVLLTAELLPAEALDHLVDEARGLGLAPFIELTAEHHVESLTSLEGVVVAVNNKDIRRREREPADLRRSLALVDALRARGCTMLVSASGISGPDDARALLDAGFDGLLIGTALAAGATDDAWAAVRRPTTTASGTS